MALAETCDVPLLVLAEQIMKEVINRARRREDMARNGEEKKVYTMLLAMVIYAL